MKRRLLDLCLLAVSVTVLSGSADAGYEAERPESPTSARDAERSIERFLDETLPRGASGTLVAARDGEAVLCEGFGMADRGARVAAGCNTVYDTMSITKQFTAAAILKLEMTGVLRVEDPIGAFFGQVPDDKREITLHQLLTHTAGLTAALGDDYQRLSRNEMIDRALESELRSPPGARHHYSNLGYGLLAVIIEKASGMGYEEFLAKHLFGPAGMRQTGYVLPEWKRRSVAVEYDASGKPQGQPFDHPWAADGPYWNLRGNGGMLSTSRDMFRWHRALEGDEVLDSTAKEKLFTPHVLEQPGGNSHYGYGWVVVESRRFGKVVWHNGGNGWSFSMLTRLLDQRLMVFWVTNRYRDSDRGWDLSRLEPRLTRGVAERL